MSEALVLREAQGWVSPMQPVEIGKPLLICANRGHYEWLLHPVDAARYVEEGVLIDGVRLDAVVLEEWPEMGALQVVADEPQGAGSSDFQDSGAL